MLTFRCRSYLFLYRSRSFTTGSNINRFVSIVIVPFAVTSLSSQSSSCLLVSTKVILIAHSMGCKISYYFLRWVLWNEVLGDLRDAITTSASMFTVATLFCMTSSLFAVEISLVTFRSLKGPVVRNTKTAERRPDADAIRREWADFSDVEELSASDAECTCNQLITSLATT